VIGRAHHRDVVAAALLVVLEVVDQQEDIDQRAVGSDRDLVGDRLIDLARVVDLPRR